MSEPTPFDTLDAIRRRAPLIHNITNLVVTNTTANALLAVGASPAMVEGAEEVEEFAAVADALVIKLGTMSAARAASIRLAAAAARAAGVPWVLDPVAVGAIGFRSRLAADLLRLAPSAIRGNASEVMAIAGGSGGGRGVDTAAGSEAARAAASDLAARTGAVVAVTGAVDYVTDGTRTLAVANGHRLMTRVTGMGCTATAITGACLAVQPDRLLAAAHALVLTGVAGEIAALRCRGPGSMQVEFLDALHLLDEAALAERARLGPA
jgi:hydroxyethylthiazole kinase